MAEKFGISRRGLLAGAAGVGVGIGAGLSIGTPVFAADYTYTSPQSFDDFIAAFESSGSAGQATDNNENGVLAWGQAYVLLGLIRMYEATRNTKYLDHFVQNTDLVLAQRDQVRGVADYRGVSGPVWRALGNYTAATATLKDRNGNPLLQVRSAQSSVNNHASVEVVHSGETDTSPFTLILRPARGTAVTVSNVNFNVNSSNYVFKVIYNTVYNTDTRWSVRDVRPDHSTAVGLPVAGTTTLQPAAYVFPVHTGQICYPIASFVRLVYTDATLSAYRSKADGYLAAVQAAMAFHDREYWVNDVRYGAYKWIKETPVPADGSNQPQNQCNMLGATAAELYRATRSSVYASKVGELKRGFRASFTYANDAYYWPYWGIRSAAYAGWSATGYTAKDVSSYTQTFPAARQVEDLSHAALNLEFAIAAYRTGLPAPDSSFTTVDMQRLANTYLHNIAYGSTGAHLNVNGTGTAGAGYIDQVPRWIPVAEWNHSVYSHALAVTNAQKIQPTQGSHVLGFAYCVYGAIKFA
ncbi:hypothetical protein [Fodinicola acaciae]|uniref:hypothetical protein n=1 Tax=Fodinicola acaciae TaxID=2681555 RepID=UPI0013D486AA|nr:hypothetical protein [Fodinicola acaciae]